MYTVRVSPRHYGNSIDKNLVKKRREKYEYGKRAV